MAIYTLDDLRALAKEKSQHELMEIILPWCMARYNAIYAEEERRINDKGFAESYLKGTYMFIRSTTTHFDLDYIDDQCENVSFSRFEKFVAETKEKIRAIPHVRRTIVTGNYGGITIRCHHLVLAERGLIDFKARELADLFTFRILHCESEKDMTHLENTYNHLKDFME